MVVGFLRYDSYVDLFRQNPEAVKEFAKQFERPLAKKYPGGFESKMTKKEAALILNVR